MVHLVFLASRWEVGSPNQGGGIEELLVRTKAQARGAVKEDATIGAEGEQPEMQEET